MKHILAGVVLILTGSGLFWTAEFRVEFVAASDEILSNLHEIDLTADGKHIRVSDLSNDLWLTDSGNNRVVRHRILR